MAGSLPLKNDMQPVTQLPQSRRQVHDVLSAAESVSPISDSEVTYGPMTRPATLSSSATSLSNSTDFSSSSSINIHTKLLALWCQHKLNSGIKKLNFLFKMLTILEADVHHPPKSNTSFPNPNKKIYAQHF